jgi:hypothetical protein
VERVFSAPSGEFGGEGQRPGMAVGLGFALTGRGNKAGSGSREDDFPGTGSESGVPPNFMILRRKL